MSTLHDDRLALGPAAVLSVSRACTLLPFRDSDARAWLEGRGLIVRRPDIPGPCVIWGDVLEALRGEPQGDKKPRRALKRHAL
jgi:hypothetical protein